MGEPHRKPEGRAVHRCQSDSPAAAPAEPKMDGDEGNLSQFEAQRDVRGKQLS